MSTPHPAVAAVLAATPLPPGNHPQVVVGYEVEPFGHGTVYNELTGDAEPIAARQAVALLRWCAAMFAPSPNGWPNSLADDIEATVPAGPDDFAPWAAESLAIAEQALPAFGEVLAASDAETRPPDERGMTLEAEVAALRQIFDLQWTRMGDATERWRAEDPTARAQVMPDLGDLLAWLMEDADNARAEVAEVREQLAIVTEDRAARTLERDRMVDGLHARDAVIIEECERRDRAIAERDAVRDEVRRLRDQLRHADAAITEHRRTIRNLNTGRDDEAAP